MCVCVVVVVLSVPSVFGSGVGVSAGHSEVPFFSRSWCVFSSVPLFALAPSLQGELNSSVDDNSLSGEQIRLSSEPLRLLCLSYAVS